MYVNKGISAFCGLVDLRCENALLRQQLLSATVLTDSDSRVGQFAVVYLWRKAWAANGTAAEQRLAFIKGILARKPEAKSGTKHVYSNQGYAIAGVVLEKATGKTWEDLLRSMLFEPLGMTTAGFGAPASVDKVDQPWGHTKKMLSGSEPIPPGPGADNPLAISPAGAVHCSMGYCWRTGYDAALLLLRLSESDVHSNIFRQILSNREWQIDAMAP